MRRKPTGLSSFSNTCACAGCDAQMTDPSHTVAIVGGGIVGLATALALSERFPRCGVTVVEKEGEVARHQTGHNSGVIHAGIYYRPGSYKARLCVEGVQLMKAFCEANGVRYENCGKVVVATSDDELPRLQTLYERGTANGVPGLEMIGLERLRELEPHARAVRALHSPSTAIVDYTEVTQAMARTLAQRGVSILTGRRVQAIRRADGRLRLDTTHGEVVAHHLINCAGLYADAVARLMGVQPDMQIIPFRGEYYTLRPGQQLVRGLIYPVPDPELPFLGVHFTKRIQGDIEAGPNAVLAFAREGYRMRQINVAELLRVLGYRGFRAMAAKYWRTGAYEFYRALSKPAFVRALRKLVPDLQGSDMVPGGSGVRAQAVSPDGALVDDFKISETPNAIHVLNAPSPAATASLAIGKHIAALAGKSFGLEGK
jgi:L-2-hydroxyglutarate oxidase LhgO